MRLSVTPRRLTAFTAALLCAALLAACGSSSDDSSGDSGADTGSSGSSGGDSALVQEAKDLVAGYTAEPTDLGVTEPIKGDIPSDFTIDYMDCGAPACSFADPVSAAADVLGWKVERIIAGPTPDKITEGWDLAVRNKPDAVFVTGFPKSTWAPQLKQLEDLGIPVVVCCTTDEPGEGVIFVENGTDAAKVAGKMQADWVVADTDGDANALYLNVPAYPILGAQVDGFTEEYKRLCPDCTMDTLDLNVADLGTPDLSASITGYLQSHPDVNYLVAGTDDALVGLPAALGAANITGLKAVGTAPSTVNLNLIANDQLEVATVSFPTAEIGWKAMDVIARNAAGDSLDADTPPVPRRILTKDNIDDPDTLSPTISNYQDLFKELWGK